MIKGRKKNDRENTWQAAKIKVNRSEISAKKKMAHNGTISASRFSVAFYT